MTDYGTIFIMLFGFSFTPAHLVSYLIGERVREEKQVQRVMGVSPVVYWAAAFIWDTAVSYDAARRFCNIYCNRMALVKRPVLCKIANILGNLGMCCFSKAKWSI